MLTIKIPRKIKYSTKVRTGLLLLVVISLGIIFTYKFPLLRYIKYLIFPTLLLVNTTQDRPVFRIYRGDKNFLYYVFLWVFASLVSVIVGKILNGPGELSSVRVIKEFYFINTSLISILLLFNISSYESIMKALKIFIIGAFIYVFIIDFDKIVALLSYRSSIFYFVTPPTESYLTSIFGAAFIYYLTKKDKKMMLLTFLLTVVGAKRIVFVAVIATTFLYFMLRPFKNFILSNKPLVIVIALLSNFAVAGMMYALAYGAFDELIYNLTGIPPNWLLSGRVAMYKDVFDYMGNIPILPKGLGYIGTILADKKIHYNDFFIHMHSDVLKYMIEFGLMLFAVVFGFMYRVALKNYEAFILVIYFNIFMITDNPSILYEFYVFFYIMFLLLLRQPSDIRGVSKNQVLAEKVSKNPVKF